MWLNQNEIQTLWKKQNTTESKSNDFRLFAPNNATILRPVINAENKLSVSTYFNLVSLQGFLEYKKRENKENISSILTLTQHFSEHEKQLRKEATEFDKINNKYVFDSSKIDYLAMSYDYYRSQKWKRLLNVDSKLLTKHISPTSNWVVDEIWNILSEFRKENAIFENLKLNYYNPKKQFYVTESETKKIVKTGKVHYLKYRIEKEDAYKISNVILDQINDALTKHITFQNDIVDRIKILSNRQPKKASIRQILGLSKQEFEKFDSEFTQKDIESQKNLEYLQGHLSVVEQNIDTLKKIKQILLYQYDTSVLVGFDNIWHSLFTMALVIQKDVDYSIFYLSKSKEVVILPESEAVQTLSILLNDNIVDTPEVVKKLQTFNDSSEFFNYLDVGIQKLASIKGNELEGIKINLVGDIDIDSFDYNQKNSVSKVILTEGVTTSLHPITPLHQFNIDTFEFLNKLNFPIINKLSNQGKLINMGSKFQNLENYVASYSENYLVEIFEKSDDYFAAKSGVQIEKTYSTEDSVTELYSLPEKNWFLNFPTPKSLASRNEWAIPLPIFKNENKTMWLDSFEDLASKSINPIYRIVLGKNLKYEYFENTKAVLLSDSVSKIPLGLSTVQYRSKILTELRKEKRPEWSVFCAYADKLYEEILELFSKYDVVQIQFSNEEAAKWQNWFFGKEEDYISNSNSILYFYKKVRFEDNEIKVEGMYNYLNLQKNTLKEIFIADDMDNPFVYSGLTLDYTLEQDFLEAIAINNAGQESTNLYYQTANKSDILELQEKYQTIYKKKKELKHIDLNLIDNSEDIEKYFADFESDVIKITLCKHSMLTIELLNCTLNQEILLAENINRFYYHRSTSQEGNKDPIMQWLAQKTIDLKDYIEANTNTYNYINIQTAIYDYIYNLNTIVFPLIKQLASNDKGANQKEMSIILNNFVFLSKPFLPFLSEKVFQVIYEDKLSNSIEYQLNYITLKSCSSEVMSKIENLIQLQDEISDIRTTYNIPLYQGLYADFGYLKDDQVFIKYLQTTLNLVPKSLMNVDGQIEKLTFQNNPIIIDMVLDSNLLVIACQKELARIISTFKSQNSYKSKQNIKLQINYQGFEDKKILTKLKLNTFWPDLFVETVWSDEKVDINEHNSYQLLDIAKVFFKVI